MFKIKIKQMKHLSLSIANSPNNSNMDHDHVMITTASPPQPTKQDSNVLAETIPIPIPAFPETPVLVEQEPKSYDFGINGVKIEHFENILPVELANDVRAEVPTLKELQSHRNSLRSDFFCSTLAGTSQATPYRYAGKINKANHFPSSVAKVLQWLNEHIGKRYGVNFNCGVINYYPPSVINEGRTSAPPCASINWHSDLGKYRQLIFGEALEDCIIAGVNIDLDPEMSGQVKPRVLQLRRRYGDDTSVIGSIPLTDRSVTVMKDKTQYLTQHCVPKQDANGNLSIKANSRMHPGRINLTFRVDKIRCQANTFCDSNAKNMTIKVQSLDAALERYEAHLKHGVQYLPRPPQPKLQDKEAEKERERKKELEARIEPKAMRDVVMDFYSQLCEIIKHHDVIELGCWCLGSMTFTSPVWLSKLTFVTRKGAFMRTKHMGSNPMSCSSAAPLHERFFVPPISISYD